MSDNIYTTNGFYYGANLITEIYFSRIFITESYTNITDLLSFNRKTARQYIIWIYQRAVFLQFHFYILLHVIKSIRHCFPFHRLPPSKVFLLSLLPSRHQFHKPLLSLLVLPDNQGSLESPRWFVPSSEHFLLQQL